MISKEIIKKIQAIIDPDYVITDENELIVYECDAIAKDKYKPEAVVLPLSTEEVSEVVKLLNGEGIPFTARGAGTGLSGGCLALKGGVIICLSRMRRILEIDTVNRVAVVEPGVVNLDLTQKTTPCGYLFAPDPASQTASTISGNVAANAGGPHTLKNGATIHHVLGLEVVLPDGSIVKFGGKGEDSAGYDLTGLMVGSEGTLGIITKIIVKLIPVPEECKTFYAVFEKMVDATTTCSEIIANGIVPTAMEIIDYVMISALEKVFDFDFPKNLQAVVVMEIDGLKEGLQKEADKILDICKANNAMEALMAKDDDEKTRLWSARKNAFGAIGRISPNYYTNDGVIPRTKLPEILNYIQKVSQKYGLTIANTFHAGDGNIHPAVFFDEKDPDQVEKSEKASTEILRKCVDLGGSVSGEHGIGCHKMKYMSWIFNEDDFTAMRKIKELFDPEGLCNPGKVFE
ncbi:FAD-binding protein [bacterium]|nr:FAD-binding protein [bacterium]